MKDGMKFQIFIYKYYFNLNSIILNALIFQYKKMVHAKEN